MASTSISSWRVNISFSRKKWSECLEVLWLWTSRGPKGRNESEASGNSAIHYSSAQHVDSEVSNWALKCRVHNPAWNGRQLFIMRSIQKTAETLHEILKMKSRDLFWYFDVHFLGRNWVESQGARSSTESGYQNLQCFELLKQSITQA